MQKPAAPRLVLRKLTLRVLTPSAALTADDGTIGTAIHDGTIGTAIHDGTIGTAIHDGTIGTAIHGG